ncbi:hypothetical protein J7E73_17195 [Paenibacillus albidus]|uniref:hypothetical protein n=1 Tax=Paenibacillus albidus TaxID=2041023 RepID=UPI001BE73F33|nr:hypothetical protein [Paenibacillus albidus]MBT2290838.1 hypothetical protein [Paenibacillus albidus]
MVKKHCLFCDAIVPIEPGAASDKYIGCYCSPDGFYSLAADSYEPINALSHHIKREAFPVISAYIREQTDCGNPVILSSQEVERLAGSPEIPVTLENKGGRFLAYLYRHTEGPEEPVVIQPLAHSYNLTYSPNLQELVYIIDKLGNEGLIIREGMSFKLTSKGWGEAAAHAGGRKLKSGCLLIAADEATYREWADIVVPQLEQCGYQLRLYNHSGLEAGDRYTLEQLSGSKLILADLTGSAPGVLFAAGYALGQQIPVIWTEHVNSSCKLPVQPDQIRPLVWDDLEELASLIKQRLMK